MKKVLSVALSLCLLISGLATTLFSAVSATEFATVFDDPANWVVYSNGATGLGTTATTTSWASVSLNTDTSKTFGGDASSLRLRSYCQYASIQFDVKPNTEYTFSYRMFYDGTNTTDKLASTSSIISVGGTPEWGKDGCYDIYGTSGSARCDSGLWETTGVATSTTAVRGNIKQWQEGGKWHQVVHTFNSGDNEEMIFAFRVTVANDNNFYLDDFSLTSDEEEQDPETNSANILSFENEQVGDHLAFVTQIPESGSAPAYPSNGKWGIVCNNGFITYTDVTAANSKVANTYTETIYKANGTAQAQTEHQGRKVGGWTYDTNLTVSNAVAKNGKNSFEIKSADMAYATGFEVPKAGKYTISYYVNDISAIKSASSAFGTAVLTTVNVGANRTGSDVYYTETKSATVQAQLPNHLAGANGNGAWSDYTLSKFHSTTDLAEVTLEDGETWYKVTHNFETLEAHKSVYFAIYNKTGANVYIDDIEFAEVETPSEPEEEPEETYSFEDIKNWGLYYTDASGDYAGYATIDGTAPTVRSWASITVNTNVANTASGEGTSIKLRGNTILSAVKLPELKANTKYTLSFKYMIPKDYTWGASSLYWFGTNIVKKGTALNKHNPVDPYFAGAKATAPASPSDGSWQNFNLEFETDDTLEYFFTVNSAFASGYDIYVDEFELTENGPASEPDPKPTDKIVQDFENYTKSKNEYYGNISVVTEDGNKALCYDATAEGANSAAAQNRVIVNPMKDGHAKLSAFVTAGETFTITMKYKLVSGSADFYMNCVTMGDDASKIPSTNPISFKVTAFSGDGWKELTAEYSVKADATAGEYDYPILLISGVGKVLIDDIVIEKKATTPDPDPTPDPEPDPDPNPDPDPEPDPDPGEYTYDDVGAWGIYHENQTGTINGNGVHSMSWVSLSQNTDKNFTYNGGDKSIKFYGNIHFIATKLKDLEQGKNYKVSFKYFAPTTSTVGTSSKAWTNTIGIYAEGTAMSNNLPSTQVRKGTNPDGESGKWNEFTMIFKAQRTDLYFGMALTFAAGYTIYIDDFAVSETDEDPDVVPVVPGKEPKEEVTIDFDNYGDNATFILKDRFEIVDAKGYDGKTSKMLHIKKGVYSSATTLNYEYTYANDNDNIFTFGVKPGKVYNLSFRVKTDSQVLEAGQSEWIGLYASYKKQYLVSSYQHNGKRDEWLYFEYAVSIANDQNLLSFYINAGNYTPDIWIDDIKLVETQYEAFTGWGDEPKEKYVINFDDFYVNYDIPCATIVDGPMRDGKVTKATYLKGGSYNYNTVANYSAVTNYRDPVFTIPVKENTLYEFSYYIYVARDTGKVEYFAVYYDWANTWVLRASGMTERDRWVKKSIRFVTNPGQTKLSITFNGGKVIPDIYLDDIVLEELHPGVMGAPENGSYCETPFNAIDLAGYSDDINAGKSGVYKIPVKTRLQHTFGIDVQVLKKSNSRVFLSFDGVTPMGASVPGASDALVTTSTKNGRFAVDFISDASGYVYLVIENDDGALKLGNATLFTTLSLSSNRVMGKDEMIEQGKGSLNAGKDVLTQLVVFGDEDKLGVNSPTTGDTSVMPIALIALSMLMVCAVLFRKRKEGEQA